MFKLKKTNVYVFQFIYKGLLNKDSKKRKLFNLEKSYFYVLLNVIKKSINKHFAKKKKKLMYHFLFKQKYQYEFKKGK